MYNIFKEKKERKGMALVMALLISSLIMASVLLFTRIILNEIKMSLNSGNSIFSFYIAESGIEKALYEIKEGVRTYDFINFNNLEGATEGLDGYDYTFTTANISSKGFTTYNISTSSPVHVDIINPAGEIAGINWNTGTNLQYNIDWSIDNCYLGAHGSDRLEVTWSAFMDNFSIISSKTILPSCNCGNISDDCAPISSSDFSSNRYYRFKFRSFDDTIKELSFNISDNDGDVGILSQAKIVVEGEYNNSKYTLEAKVPSLAPVSDIFSYVMFSEQSIRKEL